MADSAKETADGRFGLVKLDLTSTERADVVDFLGSWKEHGGPVLFVGAGMSRFHAVATSTAPPGVEIQDWAELIETLKGRLAAGDTTVLERLPSDYLRIAQHHEDQFWRSRLLDAIEEALASPHFAPGPAHQRLKRFPWKAIITTNYDNLIERSYENDPARHIVKAVCDHDLTRSRPADAVLLVKMHGDLAQRDSIVLTEEDYQGYEQSRPGILLKVKQLLLEHPTMFVGFSLSDPNFAAIEAWIRKVMGRHKLPSIALVHHEPLAAERDEWAERGIRLVQIRKPHETLVRFLDALHEEVGGGRPSEQQSHSPSADNQSLRELLRAKPNGWERSIATLLVRLTQSAGERDFSDAAHLSLLGGFERIRSESIRAVLDDLEPAARRAFLLRAHRSGVPFARGSEGQRIDLEGELLGDATLAPHERAEVLLQRAARLENAGDLEHAKTSLMEARGLDATVPEQVHRRLRSVLLRLGDEAAIAEELLDGPIREDAFAYARRGSDALMTRGRHAARRWYKAALDAARNGDEKISALYGLQASRDPGDWSGVAELDAQRMAILPAERPRVEKLWEVERDAAELLLSVHRKGHKRTEAESTQAIEKLRKAVAEADDMGWPKCPGPNHTTAADGLAYAIVGLSVSQEDSVDALKSALTLIVERGLLSLERHVDSELVDRVLANRDLADWARRLLEPRPEAMYMKRSRSLLRSALLPILTDAAIDAHILEVVPDDVPERDALLAETPSAELHLALLRRHFRAMPRASALRVMALVGRAFSESELRSVAHADWLGVPIYDWITIGTIVASDAPLVATKIALEAAFRAGVTSTDPFARRACLRMLDELNVAATLSPVEVAAFRTLLDIEIEKHGTPARKDEPQETLEFVRIRADLGEWAPPAGLRGMFLDAYRRLRNSSVAGTWFNAVNLLAPVLTAEDRVAVARNVDDYIEECFRMHRRFLAPDPLWAATGVHQAAQARVFSAADAESRLLRLAEEFPGCAAFALELDGVDAAGAEQQLVRGVVEGIADENDLLRWCNWWPNDRECGRRLEATLLGQLYSRQPELRRGAYLALGILSKKNATSPPARQALVDAIFSFGLRDKHWGPRAGAVVAAARLATSLTLTQLDEIGKAAAADDAAHVRRAGGFIEKAHAS
jgi:hypothetical protein